MVSQTNINDRYEIGKNQASYVSANQDQQAGFSWKRFSSYITTSKFIRIRHGIYRLVQSFQVLIELAVEVCMERATLENISIHFFGVRLSSLFQPTLPGVEDG